MDATTLLDRLNALLPAMQARAAALDAGAAFPSEDIADLRTAGVLAAAVPGRYGGLGIGTEPHAAGAALGLFRALGRGNLALGRLVEAHVNALRLVFAYADEALCRTVADDAQTGHLCGLWVTDPPGGALHAGPDGALSGHKQFCSGAGHVTRAVVTVEAAGGTRLAYARLDTGVTVKAAAGWAFRDAGGDDGTSEFRRGPGRRCSGRRATTCGSRISHVVHGVRRRRPWEGWKRWRTSFARQLRERGRQG